MEESKKYFKIKKSSLWKLGAIVLFALLVASILTGGFGINTDQQDAQPQPRPSTSLSNVEITDDDVVKGAKGAPVTIIEYSDFSCPFCGGASGLNQEVVNYLASRNPGWEAPIPGIIENYVNTGKVKLVYRYYPGHGTGQTAMKMALCANEQDKFWEAHDVFFANQDKIEDDEEMYKLLDGAGVDTDDVMLCLKDGKYDSRLAEDTASGRQLGITGTPAFLIGNDEEGYEKLVGAQPYSSFEAVIEALL